MLQTFSLGQICILIGTEPEKNEGLRETSNHQGKGIKQTSPMGRFARLSRICNLHALYVYSTRMHDKAERLAVLRSHFQWGRVRAKCPGG